MRATILMSVALLCGACATVQGSLPPPGKADEPNAAGLKPLVEQSPVDEILDALDARGKDLTDFQADLSMLVEDNVGSSTENLGTVKYARRGEGDARILVTFDKKKVNEREPIPEKTQYLLAPPWLVERDYRRKVEVRRQILKEGEKINLLKLGEGPFPLPLGQAKEDVHRQFDVEKVSSAKEDPANTVHIELKPKAGTQFDRKYRSIGVWVDRAIHMPVRIQVVDKDAANTRTTNLSNIRVNTGLADAEFTLPPLPGGWERHEEAYRE